MLMRRRGNHAASEGGAAEANLQIVASAPIVIPGPSEARSPESIFADL
jgi:hypothetical protein